MRSVVVCALLGLGAFGITAAVRANADAAPRRVIVQTPYVAPWGYGNSWYSGYPYGNYAPSYSYYSPYTYYGSPYWRGYHHNHYNNWRAYHGGHHGGYQHGGGHHHR